MNNMWDKVDRILTTAVLTYIHVCYVALFFSAYVNLWGRYSGLITSAIWPHAIAALLMTLVLMVCYVVHKRSDLRMALWKRIMLVSAIVLSMAMFFMPVIGHVREYTA
jgi:hypothetical protein